MAQVDVRLHNPAYAYLRVAGFWRWETPIVCPNGVDKVVETEKCFQGAVPLIAGAYTFWVGKEDMRCIHAFGSLWPRVGRISAQTGSGEEVAFRNGTLPLWGWRRWGFQWPRPAKGSTEATDGLPFCVERPLFTCIWPPFGPKGVNMGPA